MNYYAKVTRQGMKAITEAAQCDEKVKLTHFAAGDAGGEYYAPTGEETALINEKWRGTIEKFEVDKKDPTALSITAVIPNSVGGFTIREMGIFDENNNLIAIGNSPDFPKVSGGNALNEFILKMKICINNMESVEVVADNLSVGAMITEAVNKLQSDINETYETEWKQEVKEETEKEVKEIYEKEWKPEIMQGYRNKNLLINGDFIINQRGQEVYNNNCDYTCDRWQMVVTDGGSVSKVDEGVKLYNITADTKQLYIRQILEAAETKRLIGKKVTFSAKIKLNNYVSGSPYIQVLYTDIEDDAGSFYTINATSKSDFVNGEWFDICVTGEVPSEAKNIFVVIGTHYTAFNGILNAGCEMYVTDCKLEVGEIATEFEPSKYGEELAKCQRYCICGLLKGLFHWSDTDSLHYTIPLPVTLRKLPSIVNGDKIAIYDENNNGYDGLEVSMVEKAQNCIAIQCKKENHGITSNYANILPETYFDAEIY